MPGDVDEWATAVVAVFVRGAATDYSWLATR